MAAIHNAIIPSPFGKREMSGAGAIAHFLLARNPFAGVVLCPGSVRNRHLMGFEADTSTNL